MSSKNKTFELAQLVLLLAGVITLMTGFFLPPGLQEGLKGILHSLGTAFLAGSFIGLFNKRYLPDETLDICKEWGLADIYEMRMEADKILNECVKTTAKQIDGIVQGGLYSLRRSQDIKLDERIKLGLKMRLLIPLDPRMAGANKHLEDWYHALNDSQKKNVTIRRYDEPPQELYFRVDDILVVGPYFAHIDGPRTITYRFNANSTAGKIYKDHFDDLWESAREGELK
jgi:hypothetical protein